MIDELSDIDHMWMKRAMQLADKAQQSGEVPVGAIVVLDNEVIGEGYNQPITTNNPAAHAEVLALQQAARHLENYRTVDTTLYVTLEPCPMCAGLMVHARVKRLVFGAYDNKTGAAGSVMNLLQNDRLNHQISITGGVEAEACGKLLSDFFRRRRAEKRTLKNAN
jgi:tRNA(adenine34) deaminase